MEDAKKKSNEVFGATIRINSDDLAKAHERARMFIDDLKEIEAIRKKLSDMPSLPNAISWKDTQRMADELGRMMYEAETGIDYRAAAERLRTKQYISEKSLSDMPRMNRAIGRLNEANGFLELEDLEEALDEINRAWQDVILMMIDEKMRHSSTP